MKKLACVVTLLTVSTAQAGVVIYVDDDAPAGGDGLSWATAHRFLQDALGGLADDTEIRVAQGAYKPDRDEANPVGTGDPFMRFDLGFDNDCCYSHELATCTDEACETLVCAVDPLCCDCCLNDWEQSCADLAAIVCGDTCQVSSGIALIGGYAGLGAPDPDARDPVLYETVLTGDLLDNDVPMAEVNDPSLDDNSFHLITANGSDLVVDGFVITGGATNGGELPPMDWGGGLLVVSGNVTVQSCTFTGNIANAHGGAIAFYLGTQAVMTDCTVTGNRGASGGGIYLGEACSLTMTNCEVSGNISGNQGGGIYASQAELVAIDSTFSDNVNETNRGGGIHARFMTLAFSNCTFSGNDSTSEGGGLYIKSSVGTATSCTFAGNSATFGGAVHIESSFDGLAFDGCTFDSNSANSLGGALNHDGGPITVTDTLFAGNSSSSGGAIHAVDNGIYTDCTFVSNVSTGVAGAFKEEGASTFTNCLFEANVAMSAGAMYIGRFASPDLIGCTFRGNISVSTGGAVRSGSSQPRFANCLFTGNTAPDQGGAASFGNDADVVLSNCTIAANTTTGETGGIFATGDATVLLTNCILWNNTDASGATESAQLTAEFIDFTTVSVDYSCIEGLTGALGGAGNIGTDPMFVDLLGTDGLPGTEDDDLHLEPGSPAIDAGNSSAVLDGVTSDLDGNSRFIDDLNTKDTSVGVCPVDMGAYEFQAELFELCCTWDCGDGDGSVGIVDFLALLSQWGMVGTSCDFGLTKTGVGIADFLELLARWGDCS